MNQQKLTRYNKDHQVVVNQSHENGWGAGYNPQLKTLEGYSKQLQDHIRSVHESIGDGLGLSALQEIENAKRLVAWIKDEADMIKASMQGVSDNLKALEAQAKKLKDSKRY